MALPDDMVTEVLSYLPAKSVSRFHAVSRSWRAALSSAPFIELHRRRANKPGELKLLFVREKKLYNRPAYFYTWQPGGAVRKLTPYKFHFPLLITKHLHGLVLVYTVEGYHVCNPSTGASLALPDSQLPAKMIRRPTWRTPLPCYNAVAYGLGYCSATKLYKVVRVFSSGDEHAGKIGPNCCEVLVLGALLYWRPSARQPPACFVKDWGSGSVVFVNGRLHFLSRDGGIIAFHVSRETFCSVEPPPNSSRALIKMTELDGCLCVFHGNFDYGDPYEVWLLTNYKQQRWKKICRFDPNTWTESEWQQLVSSWIAPVAMYTRENKQKKIMLVTGTCKVFAVDIPNGSAPEILFSFEEAVTDGYDVYDLPGSGLFEESLVPVGRTIEEMVLSSSTTKAWFHILKRMSTRKVSDLSLVCREWRAIIKDDYFIRSHLIHANLNKRPRILTIVNTRFGRYWDLEDGTNAGGVDLQSPHLVCSQPCHGLNAGSSGSRSFVCNPIMGYCESIESSLFRDGIFFAGQTGLGYDSETNKHALMLIAYTEINFFTREYRLECKLRYVKDEYKQCRSVDPPPRPIADMTPTHVDGKIFWVVEPNLGPISLDCEIVSFDVKKEEFEVIQGPPCISNGSVPMSILELRGALCMSCSDNSKNVIDIWMMKEVATWSVEYHIELEEFSPEYSSERTTPLAIDPNNGRILLSTGWSLGYYDPTTETMETIYTVGMRHDDLRFCPIICHESLVSTI
jgi:F-box interacting protein